MFVDSHCHLNYLGLRDRVPEVLQSMKESRVTHALCVSVCLEHFPQMLNLIHDHDNLFASVGIHPDEAKTSLGVTPDHLVHLARPRKVVAIGETGLDYLRMEGMDKKRQIRWQQDCFRCHIDAAKVSRKPLIIHTRAAAEDTLNILKEESAAEIGGVMHCFTENWSVAKACLDLGFYISISGIVTFNKKTDEIREVVRRLPLDRMLIETDAPFLAPVPMRGKTNEPSFVRYVADCIAKLRGVDVEKIAQATTENFFKLFQCA